MKQARRFVNEKGKDVIAITTPIYNEPSCTQPPVMCIRRNRRFGHPGHRVSRPPRWSNNLAVMRSRMIIFSVMVLLVTVGGVAALLRRYVFIPLKLLVDFTDKAIQGIDQELPPCGREIDKLSGNIRRIVTEMNGIRQERASMEKGGVTLPGDEGRTPDFRENHDRLPEGCA